MQLSLSFKWKTEFIYTSCMKMGKQESLQNNENSIKDIIHPGL